ncbi:MAG: hypothetical protein LBL97_04910, partial [Prevotellaceae bacterium]|nr:hypothetical protein [Prevotellaceae bacterium]
MKHHPCLTLFVLLCCAFTVSNAQNRHKSYLVYRDSVANRDTLVFGGIILKDTPTNQQYSITLLAADREQVFTPHDIVGFYDGRVLRMSKSLFVDGRVQQ